MAAPSQLVGQTLSHYRIIEQIGAGGMGVVYRAHDEQLERDVAIKVLPAGTLADEAARKRFRREALALAKLNHPNIATIFEFSSQDSTDYLVTEYISGQTLDEKLAAGALPEKEVVGLGIQLAQGLSAAHEHGIVHRDLKPANLRVTSDGRLKILDFGLAQLMPHSSEIGMTATLTQSQEVTGTLPYMAPEQLRGEPAEARTDIWAAGAVLYEMATAHRPFGEKVATALAGDIIHKAPSPPRKVRSELSPKLEAVILKCLEKEQVKRYSSARELQSDLERLSTGVTPLVARRRLWLVSASSATVVVMLAAGVFFHLHRSPRLTAKDTIVLADFSNTTGDAVFDDTLKQALAVDLEQSPFLNILSEQKLANMLRLMGRSAGDRLTEDVARDLCQRTASKALLDGSIASLGSEYVIGLRAVNCQTGDTLVEEQARAEGKNQVLKELDKAASDLRRKLGESLGSIQKFDVPVEQATTESLEALKAYSLGLKTAREKGDSSSIPFYKRAIELDSNFAIAYARLGIAYSNLGEGDLASEATKRAFELRNRVSEREKLVIASLYYGNVTGDLVDSNQALEVWAATYPEDSYAHLWLGTNEAALGQFEKAAAETRASVRLDPNNVIGYNNLGWIYLTLNRLAEAEKIIEEAQRRKLDHPLLHLTMYELSFLQGDTREMQQQIAGSLGKPGEEGLLLSADSDTEAYFGRLRHAREVSRHAAESDRRDGLKETSALLQVNAALREAEFGNQPAAREGVAAALGTASTRDVRILGALTLARIGDEAKAEPFVEQLGRSHPSDTLLRYYWLPTIRAAIQLAHRNPARAIEFLAATAPYELASSPLQPETMYPVYLRGQAHLVAHEGKEAAADFQKILDHRNFLLNFPLGALAHLQLARAYALSGDGAKARAAYQDFFALWKDADSDIPILKQAKAEYAKLQ